jgi:hypothetical protein
MRRLRRCHHITMKYEIHRLSPLSQLTEIKVMELGRKPLSLSLPPIRPFHFLVIVLVPTATVA